MLLLCSKFYNCLIDMTNIVARNFSNLKSIVFSILSNVDIVRYKAWEQYKQMQHCFYLWNEKNREIFLFMVEMEAIITFLKEFSEISDVNMSMCIFWKISHGFVKSQNKLSLCWSLCSVVTVIALESQSYFR